MYVCVCIGWIVTTRFRLYQRAPMAVSPMHKLSCTGDCCFWLLFRAVSSRKTPIIVLLTNFPQTKSAWVCIICCCSWFSFADHWHHLSLDTHHTKVGGVRLANSPMWWWSYWMAMGYPLWMGIWMGTSSKSHGSWFSWWKSHEIAINKWDMLK